MQSCPRSVTDNIFAFEAKDLRSNRSEGIFYIGILYFFIICYTKKRFMKKTALTFFLFTLLVFTSFGQVYAGLVPCGSINDPTTPRIDESKPCELCDFFVMFERIVDFILFEIVPVLAVLMVAIGGFMLLFAHSIGGPEMVSKAKKLFTSVAFGLLLIYGAWLIVNTFFWMIGINETNEFRSLPGNWWKIKCN